MLYEVITDMAKDIINGNGSDAIITSCCINAGAALMVSGLCHSIAEGYIQALDAVNTGKLKAKFSELVG